MHLYILISYYYYYYYYYILTEFMPKKEILINTAPISLKDGNYW